MRLIAAIAIIVPILAAAYVLSREPRPEPAAQVAARHAADSLTRDRVAALGLRAESVATGATRRGRLAWTAAVLDDPSSIAQDSLPQVLRRTTAWLLRDDEWQVLIENHSQAPTWEELRAGAAARSFPAPAALGAPEGRDAEQLAKRFRRSFAHFGRIRLDRRAIAVGPTDGDLAVGDSAVSAMFADWERRLGSPRLTTDGLLARVPRRAGVGWVAANLEVSPRDWGGITLPLRLTAVYRERDEDSWSLVLVHLSVAMSGAGDRAQASAGETGR